MQTRQISMYPLHPPDQLFSKVVEQVSSCYPDICCVSAPRELSTPIPRLWAGRAIKMAPVEPKWHQVEMPSTTSGAMSKGQLRNVFIYKCFVCIEIEMFNPTGPLWTPRSCKASGRLDMTCASRIGQLQLWPRKVT